MLPAYNAYSKRYRHDADTSSSEVQQDARHILDCSIELSKLFLIHLYPLPLDHLISIISNTFSNI